MEASNQEPSLVKRMFKVFWKTVLWLIALYVVFGLLLATGVLTPIARAIERQHIYSVSRAQVQKAGGWEAVEQACLNYVTNGLEQNYGAGIYYFRGKRFITNSLPQVLEALQPLSLEVRKDQSGIPVFQVVLSAGHRTGTYDTPYYALWIVCTNRPDYVPVFQSSFRGAQGLVERKGDAIFEAR